MNRLFTKSAPYWANRILGGDWRTFESRQGIDGLMRIKGHELELLAVAAAKPSTGQFRQFVAAAKEKFDAVTVWCVWNEDLAAVLLRYGFKPHEAMEPDGEKLTGFRWEQSK